MTVPEPPCPYVGRGGLKLKHALDTFSVDVSGLACADLGCNVGGFTDCLLQAGAAHVTAVDTGYGTFAYKLRIDPRVTVMERTNALHATPPAGLVDVVVVDMAWTPQKHCIPAALKWLKPGGRIITLIKPHYEAKALGMEDRLTDGVLSEADAELVNQRVIETMPSMGVEVLGVTRSPITGGGKKGNARGNVEFLAILQES